MNDGNDWKNVIWRKLGNILLDFPEFAFFLRILGGVVLLILIFLIFRFFVH